VSGYRRCHWWANDDGALEADAVVFALVRVPPLVAVDGKPHTEVQGTLLNLALVVLEADRKAESIPSLVTGGACRNVAHMLRRHF
jgi:hypothetical protein